MPKVTGTYNHTLQVCDAKDKMKFALDDLLESFEISDASIEETDNSFQFEGISRGVNTKGSIDIQDTSVKVTIDLPFSAIAFKGRVQKAIDKRVPPFLRG